MVSIQTFPRPKSQRLPGLMSFCSATLTLAYDGHPLCPISKPPSVESVLGVRCALVHPTNAASSEAVEHARIERVAVG